MALARHSWTVNARELPPLELIFGKSQAMSAVHDLLERVADKSVPVLLQGESGTGKDVLARLLHLKSSSANGP